MKSMAVKALEAEIQELSDKMENLAKARALLVYPKEKKPRKVYKKREPKVEKPVKAYEPPLMTRKVKATKPVTGGTLDAVKSSAT
jgi:hypothetical protein